MQMRNNNRMVKRRRETTRKGRVVVLSRAGTGKDEAIATSNLDSNCLGIARIATN